MNISSKESQLFFSFFNRNFSNQIWLLCLPSAGSVAEPVVEHISARGQAGSIDAAVLDQINRLLQNKN